jgi:hypothetical protein
MRGSLRSVVLLSLSFGLIAVHGVVVIRATATPVAGAEIRVEPRGVSGEAADEELLLDISRRPASDGTLTAVVPEGLSEDMILMQGRCDAIPDGAHWMGIERITLAPGAEWSRAKSSDDGEGPWLYRVESGALTIHADGPITVRRAGANAPTPVAFGSDVVLQRGDQGLTPSGVTSHWRNDGDVPTVVMEFGITATKLRPSGGWHRVLVSTTHVSALLQPPIEAAVHRLTLVPGRRLPLRELPGLELVFVESGVLALESGAVHNPLSLTPGRAETIGAGFWMNYFGRTPERAVLANHGNEPLVILTASVLPASSAPATAPVSMVVVRWRDAGRVCHASGGAAAGRGTRRECRGGPPL